MKKERLADSASLLAALGASLCCVGPFVLVALGFGAAAGAVSAFFAPWRPYLLVVAFGIVGWRLFVLYRPRRFSARACSGTKGECGPEKLSRERSLTWGIFGLVVLFAAAPYLLVFIPMLSPPLSSGISLPTSQPESPATPASRLCFAIEGMTCPACARRIEEALREMPGVESARVDYGKAEACVEPTGETGITEEKVIAVIGTSGYAIPIASPAPSG
ncbi:MAG: hypothetical protein D6679_06265 [Candidatus Hydrogenedentota bacterium]|nr:MAG: hypothetical protein D6679_06265 [Candidatus Hydrogenedentota bacterium]